ncbi:hypothetical protein [Vibrio sp. CAU 1672]|uniref:hypothetical protein n=1 Tax=Vibrio sp. CAU 1672 TaxID=3032594 RepID=UPI0023DCD8AE|nr:hypothetical protein [Vibrio sp. CAU 1672]MDF2152395.1 hypothetical protein [Vibrio sp. CAU 1672]
MPGKLGTPLAFRWLFYIFRRKKAQTKKSPDEKSVWADTNIGVNKKKQQRNKKIEASLTARKAFNALIVTSIQTGPLHNSSIFLLTFSA